jgi:hypothetical protein
MSTGGRSIAQENTSILDILGGDYRIRRRLFVIGLALIQLALIGRGDRHRSCRSGWPTDIGMPHNCQADGRRGQGPYQAGLSSAD